MQQVSALGSALPVVVSKEIYAFQVGCDISLLGLTLDVHAEAECQSVESVLGLIYMGVFTSAT